jgi:hypothetical protein
MPLRHLNWDEILDVHPAWRPSAWRLWALWPSPIDHDSCFAEAGFSDFGDSDEAWNTAFAALLEEVLICLNRYGEPRLLEGEQPTERGRPRRTLGDALLAAATDDNFPACFVGFGSRTQALLRTSDGHPVLWVASSSDVLESLLAVAASYGGARRQTLDWRKLL